MNLENKVVIVTGAAMGIGKGIALAFSAQKSNVVLVDINQGSLQEVATEIEAQGGKALIMPCDVSQAQEVQRLYATVKETYGRVDVVVNNAGIYPFKAFSEMQEAEWDKIMAVNLKSVFLLCKEALPLFSEGGSIVNISSIASHVAFAGLAHYSATKGGINAFTRGLALELAEQNIRVNAIAPGAIDTPGAGSTAMSEEARAQLLSSIPLKRQGTADDIAQLAVFLASEKAGYITGQVLVVDGGWTLR